MPWLTIQTVAFVIGALGLWLTAAGLIGRRVGEGLRCRGCGYDIAGIIEEQSSCPECGASIASEKGTVSGTRARRPRLIVAGILLLLPASGMGWFISTTVQPVSARPTWLMASMLRIGPTSANNELARELLSRWRSVGIDTFSRDALIDWGLSAWVDGHKSRGWQHAEVVRYAMAAQAISPEQVDRFVEQLLDDIGDESSTTRKRVALTIAGELGTAVRPRLEQALDEPAYRDAAVVLLLDELGNTPSDALIDAAVETLAHRAGDADTGPALDRLPLSIEARRAVRYLTHHAAICAPRLRPLLTADDAQQRLLAALALTEARNPADARAIGRAVAHALEPNETPGDALLATRALLRMGPASLRGAETRVLSDRARRRLTEIDTAVDTGHLPPALERLAGPLPWQDPNPGPAPLMPQP